MELLIPSRESDLSPTVTEDLQTIHPGNRFDGNTTCGGKEKRNIVWGFPRVANDAQESKCRNGLFHRSD